MCLFFRLLCSGSKGVQPSLAVKHYLGAVSYTQCRHVVCSLSRWHSQCRSFITSPCAISFNFRELSHGLEVLFTRHVWDGASSVCVSAALTQLCCDFVFLPAIAFQDEQGSIYEMGLHSFQISTDTFKSSDVRLKGSVWWEGWHGKRLGSPTSILKGKKSVPQCKDSCKFAGTLNDI